jgi:hypothetical protein
LVSWIIILLFIVFKWCAIVWMCPKGNICWNIGRPCGDRTGSSPLEVGPKGR